MAWSNIKSKVLPSLMSLSGETQPPPPGGGAVAGSGTRSGRASTVGTADQPDTAEGVVRPIHEEVEPHEERESKGEGDDESAAIESEEEKEPEQPYEPPPSNYIRVEFDDSCSMLVNHDCKKKILIDYINSKLEIPIRNSAFDLCDIGGNLAGLRDTYTAENTVILFSAAEVYIPCEVHADDATQAITSVDPRLDDWRDKYPKMAEMLDRITTRGPDLRSSDPRSLKSSFSNTARQAAKAMKKEKGK